MAEQGVYTISNSVTGQIYVGGSVDIHSRWLAHKRELRKGKHLNVLLQAAWDQYGAPTFSLQVLELVTERSSLMEREQHYVNLLLPTYNYRKTVIRVPLRASWIDPFDAVRFWSKVERLGDECWLWKGSLTTLGYGRIKILGKIYAAHRLAYAITYGMISRQECVCHKCDNPPCVNPDHLFVGTIGDNNRDRHSKGRCAYGDKNVARRHPERMASGERHWTKHHPTFMKGENHHGAKLSSADVLLIRERYAKGRVTQKQIAQEYGIAQTTVSAVLRRATWDY